MTTTETKPDELTAALNEIRERGYENGARGAHCARLSDDAARDVPRLLAALDEVLKLADKGGTGVPPVRICEAISRALSGGAA